MRVFVTGATGALGRPTVRALQDAGHDVSALARSEANGAILRSLGATAVSVDDLFDMDEMNRAVDGCEAIVHLASCMPSLRRMRQRRAWRDNDRLRSQGSSILVNAALAAGIRVYVQSSVTALYQDLGETELYETAPIDAAWPVSSARDAEREASRITARGGQGVVLRCAPLYGPELAGTREMVALARWRLLPSIGAPDRYVSSVHVDDAARAIAAAVGVPAGVYNVSDDEALSAQVYFEAFAGAFGLRTPRAISARTARLLLGPAGALLGRSQRVMNTMFRSVSQWTPRYPSVREGWPAVAAGLGDA